MGQNNVKGAQQSQWAPRLARWSGGLAVFALGIAMIGLTLARYDLIAKLVGFSALLGGGLIAFFALIVGILAVAIGRARPFPGRVRAFAAILISALFVGFLASRPLIAGHAPAIHDISTDLANPPRFQVLKLRDDNLVGVGTLANWQSIHRQAYGDLGPIIIAKPVAAVTADAARLAAKAGWKVVAADPAVGHVEATASVSFIQFHDDVVIRIAPTSDGKESRVDMRSVSRIGVGDLGVNARRIRNFLKDLAAT